MKTRLDRYLTDVTPLSQYSTDIYRKNKTTKCYFTASEKYERFAHFKSNKKAIMVKSGENDKGLSF